MFQRKVKRRSVILDMHGRIRALVDVARNISDADPHPHDYLDKLTLIDYLNLTKIVIGKLCKADLIRLEFDKLAFDTAVQNNNDIDADDLYDTEKTVSMRLDEYMLAVGNFSSFMSTEELWSRIRKLNNHIIVATERLIMCVHSYAHAFYDSEDCVDSRDSNPYIDALNDLNPNICLLQFMESNNFTKLLSHMQGVEYTRIANILTTLLPRVNNADVVPSGTIWKRIRKSQKKDLGSLASIIDKYQDICQELHVDKHTRYILATLPPRTPMARVLERRVTDKFLNIRSYVGDDDNAGREVYDALVTITVAIIDSIAILAAFRTMLLSKELEALRNESSNTLLDVPDKADLEAFLSQVQPSNM